LPKGLQPLSPEKADPLLHTVAPGVLPGHRQRRGRDVRRKDDPSGAFRRQCDGQGAAARPHIADGQGAAAPDPVRFAHHILRQNLRFGTRNQDGGGHLEGPSVKLLFPENILDRFPGRPPIQPLSKCRQPILRKGIFHSGKKTGPIPAQKVAQEKFRFKEGLIAPPLLQKRKSPAIGFSDGLQRLGLQWTPSFPDGIRYGAEGYSAFFKSSACSFKIRASMISSSSPRSTRSSLCSVRPMRWSVTRLWGKL